MHRLAGDDISVFYIFPWLSASTIKYKLLTLQAAKPSCRSRVHSWVTSLLTMGAPLWAPLNCPFWRRCCPAWHHVTRLKSGYPWLYPKSRLLNQSAQSDTASKFPVLPAEPGHCHSPWVSPTRGVWKQFQCVQPQAQGCRGKTRFIR